MPIFNVTIDDISPVLSYSAGWVDTDTDDQDFVDYFNQTFHATSLLNASVSFSFNGTAVWITGAMRSNHDSYAVTLDGASTLGNGFAADPGKFQQVLFAATGLTKELHTITLSDQSTRTDRPFLDIDTVEFTTGDGDASTVSVTTTIDDTSALVGYSSGWQNPPNGLNQFYYNQTFHSTNVAGASVQIAFTGNEISVFGATSTNHGAFTASLDGGPSVLLNGTAPKFRPQTLLYYASGLPDTPHTVVLTNTAQNSSVFLDFDYAVASVWTHSGASVSTTGSTRHSSNGTPVGAIVGAIVAVLVIIGLALGVWLVRRQRQRSETAQSASDQQYDAGAYKPSGESSDYMASQSTIQVNPIVLPGSTVTASMSTGQALSPASDDRYYGYEADRRGPASDVSSSTRSGSTYTGYSNSTRPSRGPSLATRYTRRTTATQDAGTQMISPVSTTTENDAGPFVSPYDAPPPDYAQVFRPTLPSSPATAAAASRGLSKPAVVLSPPNNPGSASADEVTPAGL